VTRRARLIGVVAILAAGALGVISSTQTWLLVALADGAEPLAVPGADAETLLAPLSLATLALGAALSIVGRVLRYAFGVITVAIAAILVVLTWRISAEHPVDAVSSAVTAATGITGVDAVSELVTSITTTAWPAITVAVALALLATGAFVLTTAHTWGVGDRRYRADTRGAAAHPASRESASGSRPHDAVDSWDDLSRGEDPTA
jgi:Tryptophan-associated transmembrane protein (Trp_oprn_chp)